MPTVNGTNSQATSMQVSLKSRALYNLPNPTNLMAGVMLQRESNIKYTYLVIKR